MSIDRIAGSDIMGDNVKREKTYPKVLVIAGSEPLGSAGVQADIKSITCCGAYAAGSITCIVNEDTTAVKDIYPLPVELVIGQADSFLSDVGACSIKIGMLFTEELITGVAGLLKKYPGIPAVVDPVMVNATGQRLVEPSAIEAYRNELFPLATVITPNAREAFLLLGHEITLDSAEKDMEALCAFGCSAIVKSVRPCGRQIDLFMKAGSEGYEIIEKEMIRTPNVNGTGCTFSSSIAAYLARGFTLESAVHKAEEYIDGAIRAGSEYLFGKGFGPVCHNYRFNTEAK